MAASSAPNKFQLVLIKPSHYDDEGYVIQWLRSAIPSNTLAVINGLALDSQQRRVLGEDVEIVITAMDETNTRVRVDRLVRQLKGKRALVALIGVQSNQFPRAMDLARPLRAAGIQVCLGGFHVSGSLAMLPEMPPELNDAIELGISLFAGEAEGRFDEVLQDAWHNRLKPLYNYMSDLPSLAGVPMPILPPTRVKRTAGKLTSFDAGRGCPFQCSFCTIINVQGRKSRRRSADDVEQIVRQNLKQGVNRFFITDDNFARNRDWESIFDRLIAMREQEKLNIKFVIQVDTMCHRLPHFIEKAGRAGVARVFIGLESINPDSLLGARKKQNKVAEYRKMLLEWKRAGATVFAGYIVGFPSDTPESVLRDIQTIQRELPIDLLEPHCLTPLPGSEDHLKLHKAGAFLDADLNKYDLEHVTTSHPAMSSAEWEQLYKDAWYSYYSLDHLETVMRRAHATGSNPGNMLLLLLWFYACIRLENVDPLQGGYLRRKYRKDRRPTMPRESPLVFYPRYFGNLLSKHVTLGRLIVKYGLIRYKLKRDPNIRNYMDEALTPVSDEHLEPVHTPAPAAGKIVTISNVQDESLAAR
ncbi:MAG: radical SAM protein [Acidobacteriaceae bacterium]|nr:radical SAM protein [Acidobacteriaceae bacterium]